MLSALQLSPTVVTLDNGLTVVVHEDHSAPLLATSLLYKVGAAEDQLDGGRTGKAHLFEHLVFEGSRSIPQPDSDQGVDALLGAAGVTTNAWTSHDWTVYTMEAHPGALELLFFVESDRMGWLLEGFDDVDLANQRDVVVNERLGDELSDNAHPQYTMSWLLYPEGHPYQYPVLGTTTDILEVEREELEQFFRSWYGPDNAILVVVGDIDAETVVERAEHWFGEVPTGPSPARTEGIPHELMGSERWVMVDDRAHPAMYVAWPTVPHGHPDEAALDVLSLILSGERGTRLDDPLLYDRGRVTEVGAWTSNGRLGGEFVVAFERPDEPLAPALRVVDREIARIQRCGVRQEEVDRVVGAWLGDELPALQDADVLADVLAVCAANHGDADCWSEEMQTVASVTPEDVQRVARTWLGEDRILLSVVAPGEDEVFALKNSSRAYPP